MRTRLRLAVATTGSGSGSATYSVPGVPGDACRETAECTSTSEDSFADHEPISDLTGAEHHLLLTFRSALRAFVAWIEQEAVKAGLTAHQHQLLLVVRARSSAESVRDITTALQIRHHSAVSLIHRTEMMHLLERRRDPLDGRAVRLRLTPEASAYWRTPKPPLP